MMRHDSGKVLSSILKYLLKYLLKLLFVCLLLGILYYSFKDSMGDMMTELAGVSPQVVLVPVSDRVSSTISAKGTSPG